MPMGPGTYGSQKGRPKKKPSGQLKVNMKKMPPAVQKRLMDAMKKKKKKPYKPYGKGSNMNPTKASTQQDLNYGTQRQGLMWL